MADKSMCILNDVTQNYPLCRLKLLVENFEHSTLVPKVLSEQIRKGYYKSLRTSVINTLL